MAQPVVGQTHAQARQSSRHAGTTVMAHHGDVLYLDHIHRELHGGQGVQIGMHHHIGHVTVHEHLARCQAHDFIRRYAAVGATDPHVLGLLLGLQSREKSGALTLHLLGPGTVVGEDVGDIGGGLGHARILPCVGYRPGTGADGRPASPMPRTAGPSYHASQTNGGWQSATAHWCSGHAPWPSPKFSTRRSSGRNGWPLLLHRSSDMFERWRCPQQSERPGPR